MTIGGYKHTASAPGSSESPIKTAVRETTNPTHIKCLFYSKSGKKTDLFSAKLQLRIFTSDLLWGLTLIPSTAKSRPVEVLNYQFTGFKPPLHLFPAVNDCLMMSLHLTLFARVCVRACVSVRDSPALRGKSNAPAQAGFDGHLIMRHSDELLIGWATAE